MGNAGLEEAQAGIKIAGRNINNLRYADDTTLMEESEEELKSLLMKVSDSVRPHGLQPTRFLRPWDFPGKNTGVGCHFLLQCMKVKSESEVTQSCPTLSNPMGCSLPRLLIFLPAILIPACATSSPAFPMMYSAYKLNKQGDNIQP